jgi:hypothetical protein
LTGTDLTGKDGTAASLGLAKAYTVALFTRCAEGSRDETCTKPALGFHLDPGSDLKLENTALQNTWPSFKSEEATSIFLGIAYLVAFVFTILSPIFTLFSSRFPRAAIISATFSTLATVLLIAGGIAAPILYKKLKDTFDNDFGKFGVKTELGKKLFGLIWIAALLSVFLTMYLILRARRANMIARRGHKVGGYGDSKTRAVGPEVQVTGGGRGINSTKNVGLMARIPFIGGRAKYTKVERQNGKGLPPVDDNDWDPLVRREEEEEFIPDGRRGIVMAPLNSPPLTSSHISGPLDTAYEPYRREEEILGAGERGGLMEGTAYDPHDLGRRPSPHST